MHNKVRAKCFVDMVDRHNWEVTVWGEAPYEHRRVYTVSALSDNQAAMDGLRRFEEEMEALDSVDVKDG